MYELGTISPSCGTSPGPSKPKIDANFLSMAPSDMFKMMSVLGTQTQPSGRVEMKLPASNGKIPKQPPGDDFGPNTEHRPSAKFAVLSTPQWREEISKSEEIIPERVTALTVNPKPATEAVSLAPRYGGVDYGSKPPLSKADSKADLRLPVETIAPAPRYSRKDISTLDGILPLNLPTPHYKGFAIQTSSGTFSRKATSNGLEIRNHRSQEVVPPAPQAKGGSFSALDATLPWSTLGTTNPKPKPPTETIPKLKIADITPSKETLTKGTFGSELQPKSAPHAEAMTPPAVPHRNRNPRSTGSPFKKFSMLDFGDNLEPGTQIPAPASQQKAETVSEANGTSSRGLTTSGLDVSPTSSPRVAESARLAKGGSGYSFVQGSRFTAATKVSSKAKERTVESAILKPGIVTGNPKIDRLKQMTSQRKDYMTYEEDYVVKPIAPSFQAEILSAQNQARKEHEYKEDLFTKVNPIMKLPVAPRKIKSGENVKSRNITNTSLPTLPDDAEESDISRSSSGEEGEQIKEAGPSDDFGLVTSKPWVKRLTARRRMRQGEFSKWFSEKTKEIHVEAIVERHKQDEEKMSARAMITSHNYIISDPREYQMELFEIAKQRNTIAVLDTGSGKTLIACLLIRYMVDQELESRQLGRHRRVSFFLVDCVTLVFQQAAVLNCNIDAKIGKYCGDMGVDLWKKENWDSILDDEQVIVMTADVLYNCLTHSFIKMKDINLLCFDEAHHAKKKHVYARIIKDFYLSEPVERRPKIFGMTASPVDARVDVIQAALELEHLLHSKITTTSDLMLLQSSVSRPKEDIAAYSKLRAPFQTELYSKLYSKYRKIDAFEKIFLFAKKCTSELGPWCADQVWKFALSEQEYRKLERKEERNMSRQTDQDGLDLIEKDIELLREARQVVSDHVFAPPDPETEDLSSKVVLLHRFLSHVFADDTADKCIIFVNRRYTARVLGALLEVIGGPHMKLGILIGTRAGGAGDENVTFRQQMVTVSQFRRGKLNCLIATSVAEEGLDIPDCSMIIRFDLYTTMIQYIQSRGRARHSVSRYIHMLEAGNANHRKVLSDVRSAEGIMRKFCQSLPADRLLDSWEPENLRFEEGSDRVYIEPESGAKLTFTSAMQIVGHYVGSLPHDGEDASPPLYHIRPIGPKAYVCELLLPTGSAITCVEGAVMATRAGAKRAAAFEACLQLRAKDCLDVYLLPKYRMKNVPKMANAHLALDSNKTNSYASKEKPGFWAIKDSTAPAQVWVTIFILSNQKEMGERLVPMALITREKLPKIPDFPVHSDRGGSSDVISLRLNKSLVGSEENLHKLNMFTIRLFYDLFNKLFELDYGTIPYWIAPCKNGDYTEDTLARDALDWEMMVYIMSALEFEWDQDTPIEAFIDRFLVDRRQRSRRFVVHDCDPTLEPKDLVPTRGAQAPGVENILDYSYNAGKKGAVKWKWVKWEIPETEPVLIADRLLHRLNYLDPPSEKDANTATNAYICPSAFQVSMIPCHVIHMAMIFPSISTRIDAYLHAWDVCNLLGFVDLDLGLALEAITKDSDNSHEHGETQINVRKGMGNNYERLEFLGDCFLKLATSISLFSQNHEDDEFQLHVQRMVLICNQHLFEKAKRIGLPTYIQTEGFSRRFWYPAMRQILGKGTGKEIVKQGASHRLADKSISDVCEALIGAALIDQGLDGATHMVTAILQTPDHQQTEWVDYYKGYRKPAYQIALPSASQNKLAADIEKQIGYKFKSPRLLVSAFTHSSNPYSWEKVPCYQRLEFLGDALLDLICVRYIFDKHPEADPQWLTEHKMAMVSNKFLGAISVLMGFHRKLKRVGQQLDIAIRDYETEIMETQEKSGGAADFWTSVSPPPKALPDILEAFIGAIFVDSEFNYDIVEKFVTDYILPYFVDMTVFDNFAGQHPTTFLTKRMTDLGCSNWGYESEQLRTEDEHYILTGILIHSQVFAFGKGQSAKAARISASEAALKKLNGNGLTEFYSICDCKLVTEKARENEETKEKGHEEEEEEEVVYLEE